MRAKCCRGSNPGPPIRHNFESDVAVSRPLLPEVDTGKVDSLVAVKMLGNTERLGNSVDGDGHRLLGDSPFSGYFFIGKPLGEQCQGLHLAIRELREWSRGYREPATLLVSDGLNRLRKLRAGFDGLLDQVHRVLHQQDRGTPECEPRIFVAGQVHNTNARIVLLGYPRDI